MLWVGMVTRPSLITPILIFLTLGPIPIKETIMKRSKILLFAGLLIAAMAGTTIVLRSTFGRGRTIRVRTRNCPASEYEG